MSGPAPRSLVLPRPPAPRTRRGEIVARRREVEPDPGVERAPLRPLPAAALARPVTSRLLGTFCVRTDEPVVALTYDDGPDPAHTGAVLDVLGAAGVRVTFFVLAGAAEHHPQLVRRIQDEGHELGLHGMDHRRLTTLTHRAAMASVAQARDRLEQVAGRQVRLFRPPYGAYTLRDAASLWRMGLDPVLWSGTAVDWVHDTEDAVAGRAVAALHPGGILLLHDTRADPETLGPGETLPRFDRAAVLTRLLRGAARDGYAVVPVGDLLARYPRVRSIARDRRR